MDSALVLETVTVIRITLKIWLAFASLLAQSGVVMVIAVKTIYACVMKDTSLNATENSVSLTAQEGVNMEIVQRLKHAPVILDSR